MRLWDLSSGQLLRTLDGEVSYLHGFSPHSAHLFARRARSDSPVIRSGQKGLLLWRVETGERVADYPDEAAVAGNGAWSPDGQLLATFGSSGVRLRQPGARQSVTAVHLSQEDVQAAVFVRNGRGLLTLSEDGVLRWWNTTNGRLELTVDRLNARPYTIASQPGSDIVLLADKTGGTYALDLSKVSQLDQSSTTNLQRVAQGERVFNLEASPSPSRYAVGVLSAASATEVTAFREESLAILALWEMGTGRALRELRTLSLDPGSTLISPMGQTFVTIGSDHSVLIWGIERVAAVVPFPIEGHGWGMDLSRDGRWLAVAGERTVRVWDTRSRTLVREFELPEEGLSAALSLEGRMLAVGFGHLVASSPADRPGQYARIFDLDSGRQLAELSGHLGGVMGVAFSPDGARLATVGKEGILIVWLPASGKLLMQIDAHEGGALWVSFSPDGGLIATAGIDGKVRLWSGQTGVRVREIEVSKKAAVMGLAFSPDGRRLAAATLGQPSIRIWSVNDGRLLRELSGSSDANGIGFSGDGRLIAVAGIGTSSVWDATTGERLLALGSSGNQVAFAPDNRTFYMSSSDNLVRVWRCDVCTGLEELKRAAAKRVTRVLTQQERLVYLGEEQSAP